MKRVPAVLLALTIAATSAGQVFAASSAKKDIGIVIDGKRIQMEKSPVIINGRTLVPVRSIFEDMGASVTWNSKNNTVDVVGGKTTINMRIGYMSAKVNGELRKTDVPPVIVDGATMVPVRFIAESLNSDVRWNPSTATVSIASNTGGENVSRDDERSSNGFTVVIDAGHGGVETGARYGGVNEKYLNLEISKKLNELLQAEGITTYMTRKGDSTLGLYSRSDLANSVDADLLVSVHNNAGNSRTTGTMTLYYPGSGNSTGNLSARDFASIVQGELTKKLGSRNLGVIARPNLAVLRTADMPAVIAEIGYMSNNVELNKLKTDAYQQKAAEALKNAVMSAINRM